jgi:hypothetical protein
MSTAFSVTKQHITVIDPILAHCIPTFCQHFDQDDVEVFLQELLGETKENKLDSSSYSLMRIAEEKVSPDVAKNAIRSLVELVHSPKADFFSGVGGIPQNAEEMKVWIQYFSHTLDARLKGAYSTSGMQKPIPSNNLLFIEKLFSLVAEGRYEEILEIRQQIDLGLSISPEQAALLVTHWEVKKDNQQFQNICHVFLGVENFRNGLVLADYEKLFSISDLVEVLLSKQTLHLDGVIHQLPPEAVNLLFLQGKPRDVCAAIHYLNEQMGVKDPATVNSSSGALNASSGPMLTLHTTSKTPPETDTELSSPISAIGQTSYASTAYTRLASLLTPITLFHLINDSPTSEAIAINPVFQGVLPQFWPNRGATQLPQPQPDQTQETYSALVTLALQSILGNRATGNIANVEDIKTKDIELLTSKYHINRHLGKIYAKALVGHVESKLEIQRKFDRKCLGLTREPRMTDWSGALQIGAAALFASCFTLYAYFYYIQSRPNDTAKSKAITSIIIALIILCYAIFIYKNNPDLCPTNPALETVQQSAWRSVEEVTRAINSVDPDLLDTPVTVVVETPPVSESCFTFLRSPRQAEKAALLVNTSERTDYGATRPAQ